VSNFFSPLEQFQIIPLIDLNLGPFDFSYTNSSLIMTIGLLLFLMLLEILTIPKRSFFMVPNRWQVLVEELYMTISNMVYNSIGKDNQNFFPFVFILFLFILISNLIGLIPYSFTMTSHLVVTLGLSTIVFIGVNIICIREHGFKMLSFFLPSGASLALAPLLVPVEIISYFFRIISLAVRLFANMMAGHALLKVIAGFGWTMMSSGSLLLFISHTIPLITLFLLIGLELGVACIQAFVFASLTCMYLNEAIYLH
jgi:ATP synthase subunit 6